MERIEKHILKFPAPEGPQTIREEAGLPPPEYEDERNAPPVDREALRALVESDCPKRSGGSFTPSRCVFGRSWAEALAKLDAESLKKNGRTGRPAWLMERAVDKRAPAKEAEALLTSFGRQITLRLPLTGFAGFRG